LIEVLIRLSYLTAHHPEIREFDVNPLFVSADEVIALDGRVVIDRSAAGPAMRPFGHLAIRPYPEEFVRHETFDDGKQPVTLRPIRPEDEPAWMDLVEQCSPETLHARFQYMFRRPTHEVATRFCVLDYDRELAIMAEIEQEGRRRFVGVGRLVADVDHEQAEFAVLVADAWQNRGLGLKLTDYCLEIARQWGVRRIVAQTTFDNPRMIAIFDSRGFRIERKIQDGLAIVDKALGD
jgi:acetyltransferase